MSTIAVNLSMITILGVNEVANPLVSALPIVLLLLSGYTLGKIYCLVFGSKKTTFSCFLAGTMIVNFVFIAGFVVFGVLTQYVKEYFRTYTFVLAALSLPTAYFIIRVYNYQPEKILSHAA